MHFADDGIARQPAAERSRNLARAPALEPHVTKNFDAFVGPGHLGLVYSSDANELREGLSVLGLPAKSYTIAFGW